MSRRTLLPHTRLARTLLPRTLRASVAGAAVLLLSVSALSSPAVAAGTYAEQDLAVNGEGGFPNYRIPALTVAPNGDLLASYDGRPTGGDSPAPNSILQRRSTDNGATWGAQTVVHGGTTGTNQTGYSDPSYVVDREAGIVFNFHVFSMDQGFGGSQPGVDPADRDVIHAEVSTSTDNGATWQHRIITADITPDAGWRSRFAASGQGIQLRYGPHAGRLIQQFTIINGSGAIQAVSVYSDDHGQTWQAGEPVGTGMDENKTVELSDGTVMLNSRDSAGSKLRKVAYSQDGGVTYGAVTTDAALPDPTNNASIVRAFPDAAQGSAQAHVLLFSNAASKTGRTNGTVRASCDDGKTWPVAREFRTGSMSYSTLATLPDGNIGLLYEPGTGIRFASFDLDWLGTLCTPQADGQLSISGGTLTNPKTTAYAVGDRLSFSYRVTNLSDAATTVTPSGNLRGLDPSVDAVNCRWRNMPADDAYNCPQPYHLVTQADLDRGSFTPVTTWTSTSGTQVTTVEHTGPAVTLS